MTAGYTKEKNIKGIRVRVTYQGCDFVCRSKPPKAGQLHTILTVSNAAYVRCGTQLFYINKAKNILVELPLHQEFDNVIHPEGRYHEKNNPQGLSINEPKALTAAQIQWIQNNVPHSSPGSDDIRNIELALTRKQRQKLLRKLPNRNVDSKNAAYTYIFQTTVAKYHADVSQEKLKHQTAIRKLKQELKRLESLGDNSEQQQKLDDEIQLIRHKAKTLKPMQSWMTRVHRLSTHFARFERFINNPPDANPTESLNNLLDAVEHYKTNILTTVKKLQEHYQHHAEILEHLEQLHNQLENDADAFKNEIKTVLQKGVTSFQAKRLMCIQDLGDVHQSLGAFMAEQMSTVLDTSIKIAYEINDDRLGDLVHLSPAIAALSDAKKTIEIKAFTLDGAEYNNTYNAIPESMLDVIEGDEEIPKSSKKWFSMKPYLHDWNPLELDKVLCLATNQPLSQRETPSFIIGLVKVIASFVEAGLVLTIRLPITIILSIVALLGAANWASQIDLWIARWHNSLSPVKAAKRWWNHNYRRLDQEGELVDDEEPHQALLNAGMKTSSFFHQVFVYVSPQRIADSIKSFASTFIANIIKIPQDFSYLVSGFYYTDKPEEVYEKTKWIYQLTKLYRKQLEDAHHKKYQALKAKHARQPLELEEYEALRYCDINEIASPLEVFREVMVTLSDVVIDPMFRKSPGAATFFFMLSMATFGTYLAPAAALAWMKSVPAWLQIPTNILSLHFTGKATSLGVQEQMIACFLEWKLGFFTSELLIEIHHENYEIFNDLFQEPEKLTLGLVGLIAMGASIQYLPLLPTTIIIPGLPPVYNYYAEVLNVFIDEAKGCAEGTIPFTGVEYGFLGLKFAMLMHSMHAGWHEEEEKTTTQQLAQICSETTFLARLLKSCVASKLLKETNEAKRNERFQRLLNVILQETLRSKKLESNFTDAELTAFRLALTEQISPALEQFLANKTQEDIAEAQNKLLDSEHPEEKMRKLLVAHDPQHASKTQSNRYPLEKAHRELTEAIEMASDEKTPLVFASDRLKEANKFYDHLDHLFNQYNHELQKRGRADLCVDKRDFMAQFYNKYCYQGSNNLLRSLIFFPIPLPVPPYVVPLYAIIVLFREIKRLFAQLFHKPSIEHQVEKSYSKDLVLLYQFAAIIARTLYAFNRAISYSLRAITGITLFAVAVVPFSFYKGIAALAQMRQDVSWSTFFKTIDKLVSSISLHRAFSIRFARPLYARAARDAGTIANVGDEGERLLRQLTAAEPILHAQVHSKRYQRPYIDSHTLVGQRMELADRKRAQKPALILATPNNVKTETMPIAPRGTGPMFKTVKEIPSTASSFQPISVTQ